MFDRKKYKRDGWAQSAGLPAKMALPSVVTALILLLVFTAVYVPEGMKIVRAWQESADVFLPETTEDWGTRADGDVLAGDDVLTDDEADGGSSDNGTRERLQRFSALLSESNGALDILRSALTGLVFGIIINTVGFACSRYVYQYRKTGDASFGAYVASYSPKIVLASLWYLLWCYLWILPYIVWTAFRGLLLGASHGTLAVPAILLVVYGGLFYLLFVSLKVTGYQLMCYVLAEYPTMGVRKAMTLSKKMSKGCRENLWVMRMSFYLWYLFVFVTLGFGLILFMPYLENSWINAYQATKNNALETGVLTEGDFDVLQ